ncbi:MAG: NAD(P)-dependent alcohol dehydrogenase [Dongiaceae bacterium]
MATATQLIRAAVARGAVRQLRIETLTLEMPRADEVLVRIIASGICHTDIDFCEGGVSGPTVFGHEGAGIVERVGSAVKGFKNGDHVVLSYQSCGHCAACRRDHPADCRHFWDLNFGFERFDGTSAYAASGIRGHFFGQSSFATHALATTRNIVKVDRALPLDLLAPLGCGLQTGAGTVMNSLAVKKSQSIAILGAGAVGLAAVMAARIMGAEPIIAVDMRPHRLRLAKELGATHVIDTRRSDAAKRIAKISGGVDHVVESTGDTSLDRIGRELLNPRGKMARLAGGPGMELSNGRKVLGVIQGDAVPQRFIPKLIKLWRDGRFPFERLIKVYDFADINQAIADAKSGKTIKPVLHIGGTE